LFHVGGAGFVTPCAKRIAASLALPHLSLLNLTQPYLADLKVLYLTLPYLGERHGAYPSCRKGGCILSLPLPQFRSVAEVTSQTWTGILINIRSCGPSIEHPLQLELSAAAPPFPPLRRTAILILRSSMLIVVMVSSRIRSRRIGAQDHGTPIIYKVVSSSSYARLIFQTDISCYHR